MQFFRTLLSAAALASLAVANSVHFVNQDSTTRTIVFTAQAGLQLLPNLVIPGSKTAVQSFPTGWTGNFYSVSAGSKLDPGVLGEVAFDGYAGHHYFDVSVIVDPQDINGVKMMFPKNSNTPVSGCESFPCANAYNKPDDVETQTTDDQELVCLLGTGSQKLRRGLGREAATDAA